MNYFEWRIYLFEDGVDLNIEFLLGLIYGGFASDFGKLKAFEVQQILVQRSIGI